MNKIAIENLSFGYEKNIYILKDINLEINSGEFVCILGQSGCGKSTLLRLLGGLENATIGKILIDDKEILNASLDRGIVFQDYGLFPWMTAGENIMLALEQRYKNKKRDELKKIALDMLVSVGLDIDVYGKLPKELSGGMQQRCAIAQSFSINPPILLMDEPFGALDAVTRSKLQDLVLTLWEKDEERKTVFFVTHDVDEAIFLSTRIIVLGQLPSQVIADCKVDKRKDFSRQNQFTNIKMMELRNKLIKLINSDISSHV